MHTPASSTSTHPLDEALALAPQAGDESPAARVYTGAPHAAYDNMVGPFGGASAAQMLQAVLLHPDRLGDPVALTINFAAAVANAPFQIVAEPARTNRSTQHQIVYYKE